MRLALSYRAFCYVPASHSDSRVFLTLAKGEEDLGRLEFELFENQVPKSAANFKALVSGENKIGKTFEGTVFHRIIDGFIAQSGDIDGQGG